MSILVGIFQDGIFEAWQPSNVDNDNNSSRRSCCCGSCGLWAQVQDMNLILNLEWIMNCIIGAAVWKYLQYKHGYANRKYYSYKLQLQINVWIQNAPHIQLMAKLNPALINI